MTVPFKIAIIASMLGPVAWWISGFIFRIYGSPFPQIQNKADVLGSIIVLFAIICLCVALVAGTIGVIQA